MKIALVLLLDHHQNIHRGCKDLISNIYDFTILRTFKGSSTMKKIIIVPSWIQRVLQREHCSVKEVLSYKKLTELMSSADIRAFLLLQSHAILKDYHIGENDASALLEAWTTSGGAEDCKQLASLVNPSVEQSLDKDKLSALIAGECRDNSNAKEHGIFPGDSKTLLLVLKAGYFGSEDYETQDANIVENILRVLYGEFVQEEVAQTPIFKRYVTILSKRIA